MIEFFLKATRTAKGTVLIREHFRFEGGVEKHSKRKFQIDGIVDEDIKKQNEKEYAAFQVELEKNKDSLYEAARQELEGVALAPKVEAPKEEIIPFSGKAKAPKFRKPIVEDKKEK